jgi:small-conductance mechanosensitive channel
MSRFKNLPAIALSVLLLACAVGWYMTRERAAAGAGAAKPAGGAGQEQSFVDIRLWHAAREVAATADTTDEQELAREALRLADHELDQAFATALRGAAEAKPPQSGPLKLLADYVTEASARVAASRERIAQLEKSAAGSDTSAELELAKAQLELDQDELEDARQELARKGGDRRASVDRELQQRQTAKQVPVSMPARTSGEAPFTLREQLQAWLALRAKRQLIADARRLANGNVELLNYVHDMLESTVYTDEPESGTDGGDDPAGMARRLRSLSDVTKTLSEINKRIGDSQRLNDVYARWDAVVETRRRSILHAMLASVLQILAVIAAALLATILIRHALMRHAERRKMHQLRLMATIAIELAAFFIIVLIVFGPPTQMTTMIGLATAGLTVVLKDFIVAFFGWFVLMGRNGIRVGDWVEIEGVGGEVVEIGLLRTVLLEMGGSSATGQLTGRRVAFVNSFAIERHYFNFSTAGQWLWDELQVTMPAGADPNALADGIRATVEHQTAEDSAQAEREWERVTRQYGVTPFSAKPAVTLRPTPGGVEAVVRYITRAPRRFEVKSQLFQAIVSSMRDATPA